MKSVTMATKREMSDYTVFFSVLGHKKFIHKILAKSESVRFHTVKNSCLATPSAVLCFLVNGCYLQHYTFFGVVLHKKEMLP